LNWTEIAKQGSGYLILAIVAFVSAWIWRDSHWEAVIKTAPVTRDSVVVADTVFLPPVAVPAVIETLTVTVVDSVIAAFDSTDIRELVTYLAAPAVLDTTFHGEEYALSLSVLYSPIYRTFLTKSDVILKHKLYTDTKLIYNEPEWWQYGILGASAILVGYGVAKEDYVLAGVGGVGATITLVTF